MIREHLGDMRVAHLVDDERPEDRLQHGVGRATLLLDEERTGEPLDLRHVGEVLDDVHLVLGRHRARTTAEVEIADLPLPFMAHPEHALEVHRSLDSTT